jgi:DNA polymerase theta
VNTAIDDCSISKLRAVVLDELHMVDDEQRGYLLELVATKLLSLEQTVQIVGMSATLPVRSMVSFSPHFQSNMGAEYGHDGSVAWWALL